MRTAHKQTRCEGEERDNYKRLIARCIAGNGDVNAAMVREGYAWAYVKYSQEYVGLEHAAKTDLYLTHVTRIQVG